VGVPGTNYTLHYSPPGKQQSKAAAASCIACEARKPELPTMHRGGYAIELPLAVVRSGHNRQSGTLNVPA